MRRDPDEEDLFLGKPVSRVEGIDCYVNDDYYWRELDQEKAITLIELSRTIGWRNAVRKLQDKGIILYMTDSGRLKFLDLLPIKRDSRILDVGTGWGSLAIQIARRFPSMTVIAVDRTLEGLLFLDLVKKQENLANLRIAKAGADRIPVAGNSMDFVFLIGVLEWVGESISNMSPTDAQLHVLSEVRRTLKEGGSLLLGIENRYSYKYLRGKPEHSHIRFGSVLPKRMVSFYSRMFRGKDYRTYIYSLNEYSKLLARAGYKDLRFYGAYPDYRFPRVIADLGSMHGFWEESRAPGSSLMRHLPNGLLKRVVPSYFIIARK